MPKKYDSNVEHPSKMALHTVTRTARNSDNEVIIQFTTYLPTYTTYPTLGYPRYARIQGGKGQLIWICASLEHNMFLVPSLLFHSYKVQS